MKLAHKRFFPLLITFIVALSTFYKISVRDKNSSLAVIQSFWIYTHEEKSFGRFPASEQESLSRSFVHGSISMKHLKNWINFQIKQHPGKYQQVSALNTDAYNRTMTINLVFHGQGPKTHSENISFALAFPSVKALYHTKYLPLRLDYFSINGKNNTSSEKAFEYFNTFLQQIKLDQFIGQKINMDQKNALVYDVNISKILGRNSAQYRFWQFSPVQYKGSTLSVLRIEIGKGKPSEKWILNHKRRDFDQRNLKDLEKFYKSINLYSFKNNRHEPGISYF